MLSPTNKKTVIYAIIISAVIIGGTFIPTFIIQQKFQYNKQSIIVKNSYYNTTYASNFKTNSPGNIYSFSTNQSIATVSDANHAKSTLSIEVQDGEIFYNPVNDYIFIQYNMVIIGKFTSNLLPSSLLISYIATGQHNQSGVGMNTNAPPTSTQTPKAENLSTDTLGNLWQSGFGQTNVTAQLFNETKIGTFFNFSVSVQMQIFLNWYSNSTHTFVLSVKTNGLHKTATSSVSMSIKEIGE